MSGLVSPAFPFDPALPTDALGWVLLVAGVGLLALFALVSVVSVVRAVRIARTDPVEIGSAPTSGTIEVEGTVEPLDADRTLTAPLTGSSAVAYSYKVEVEKFSRHSRRWKTVDRGRERRPFIADDGTGIALVDPEGASIRYGDPTRAYMAADERPPDAIFERIDTVRVPWEDDAPVGEFGEENLFDRSVRYSENRIEVGDTVHVRGNATDPPALPADDGTTRHVSVGIANSGWLVADMLVSTGDESTAIRRQAVGALTSGAFAAGLGAVLYYFLYFTV